MIADAARPDPQSRRQPARWTGLAGHLLVALVLVALAALVLSILLTRVPLLGYRAVILSGGSMEPALGNGALLVSSQTDPDALAAGDVITFRSPNTKPTITHRIVAVREENGRRWFTVKGDANATPDSAEVSFSDGTAYKMQFAVPYLGYVLAFIGSALGTLLLVIFPLAGLAALNLLGGEGRRRPRPERAPGDG